MLGSPMRCLVMMVALSGAIFGLACNSSTGPARSGPPAALRAVTGDSQIGPEGLYLPVPLTVQVLDAGGRALAGVTVDWTVAGGGSLRSGAAPTVTDSVGLAVVLWQLGPLGPQSVVASCCGLMGTTFTARAVLSLAQQLTILGGQSQADTVGYTLAQPIAVQVLRPDGTPDVGAVIGWGTSTPGGHFSPTFARADNAGRASTLWTLGIVAGAQTSWVRVRGFPQVLVGALAYPGPPTHITITPNPLPLLGAIDEFVVPLAEARDRYDNVVSIDVTLSAADTTIVRIGAVDTTMLRFNPLDTVVGRHHGTTWIREQFGTLRDSLPVTMLGFSAVSSGGARFSDRLHPVLIASGLGLQLPYTYVHTCALTTSGQAYCWGDDESGELGDGSSNYATEVHQLLPTPVTGGQPFATVRPGADHTCAVATSGAAYCWGAIRSRQRARRMPGTAFAAATRLFSCRARSRSRN